MGNNFYIKIIEIFLQATLVLILNINLESFPAKVQYLEWSKKEDLTNKLSKKEVESFNLFE